jgi:hypothetical protein
MGSPAATDYAHRFARQRLVFSTGKIFFSKLDVIDALRSSLGDFLQKTTAAVDFIAGESTAIGDVVKKQSIRWPLSTIARRLTVCAPVLNSTALSRESGPGFGNLRHYFLLFLFLGRPPKVVFGESVTQEFEGVFGSIHELEQIEVLG